MSRIDPELNRIRKLNAFYQKAISNEHAIFYRGDILTLIVSTIDGKYHIRLIKWKDHDGTYLFYKVCSDKDTLVDHLMTMRDAIF